MSKLRRMLGFVDLGILDSGVWGLFGVCVGVFGYILVITGIQSSVGWSGCGLGIYGPRHF